LVIKASVGTDIRILPISNEDLTYDELVLMMQRVFKDKLAGYQGNLMLKYKDDAGDLISILDTNSLTYALHDTRQILRLHIYLPEELNACYMMPQSTADELRSKCHSLLALLDTLPLSPPSPAQPHTPAPAPSPPPAPQPPAQDVPTTEFDPLTQESTPPPASTTSATKPATSTPAATMPTSQPTNGAACTAPPTNGAPSRPAASPLPTAAVRAVAAAKPHTPHQVPPHAQPLPHQPQHPHYAMPQGQSIPAGYYGAPQQMYPQQPTPPMYHPSPPTTSFYTPYHHPYRAQAPYRPSDGN